MRKRLFMLAAVLLLCSIQTLHAAQVLFTPVLILSEEYTDNLFLSSENEEYDFITTAGLDLTGEMLWRTAGIRLNYNPGYNTYAQHRDFNYWRHAASFNAWKVAERYTRFELNDTYLWSNDPQDESVAEAEEDQPQGPDIEVDPNRRGRNEYYTNVAEARLSHQFGREDSFFIAYQHRIFREADPLPNADISDYTALEPSMGITYYFSQYWSAEFDASYEDTLYKDRNDRNEFNGNIRFSHLFSRNVTGFIAYRHTILRFNQEAEADDENYDIYSPSIGMIYEVGELTRIEIAAAYYAQNFDQSEDDDGYTVNSDVSTRWQFRTAYLGLAGGSGYDIDDDGTEDNRLNIYGHARIEGGYNFTPHVLGMLTGRYRYDEFPNETPRRVRHTTGADAALDWQVVRWMALNLACDFSNVNSDEATEEYSETRVTLTLRIGPSTPLRLN